MGFVFGFDDGSTNFNLQFYLANLIKFLLFSFITLLVYNLIQKYFARKMGATTQLSLWSVKRFWVWPRAKSKIPAPVGILLPIIITLLSRGQILFTGITSTEINIKPAYRIGRKFIRLTESDTAKIAASAPLIHMLIAIVLSLLNIPLLNDLALVNTMLAVSVMLPIPGLIGFTVLNSSKQLYAFSAVFILVSALLLNLLSSFSTLIIAVIFAIAATFLFFWRYYK